MQPTSEEIRYRLQRLKESHQQLFSLPFMRNRGAWNFPSILPDPPANNPLLHSLFDDTVSRELDVDPAHPNTRAACQSYIEQARSVAPGPSLSNPSLRAQLATGYDPALLSDKSRIAEVAPQPVQQVNSYSETAKWIRIIQQRRRQELAEEEERRKREDEEEEEIARLEVEKVLAKKCKAGEGEGAHTENIAILNADKMLSNSAPHSDNERDNEHNRQARQKNQSGLDFSDEEDGRADTQDDKGNDEDNANGEEGEEDDEEDSIHQPNRSKNRPSYNCNTMKPSKEDVAKATCCFCPSFENTKPPTKVTTEIPSLTLTTPNETISKMSVMKSTELIGPFVNMRSQFSNKGLYVHYECACWAPQVFTDVKTNRLRKVYEEYCRGRRLRCSHCNEKGATVGCYIIRCQKVFHFRCLEKASCKKVDKYFAAFCCKHKHLANTKSYQLLMNAGIEADLACANKASNFNESSYGLDAPHSKFTGLQRSTQEIIFSRRLAITSVSTLYDHKMYIFSHRNKDILRKSSLEPFRNADGIRLIRASAFDVISGKLAYMAITGNDDLPNNFSAVAARAALASPHNNRIFLLRNLRHAPKWTRHEIKVVSRKVQNGQQVPTDGEHLGSEPQADLHPTTIQFAETPGERVGDKEKPNETEKHTQTQTGLRINKLTGQPDHTLDASHFKGRYNGDGTPLLEIKPPTQCEMEKIELGKASPKQKKNDNGNDDVEAVEIEEKKNSEGKAGEKTNDAEGTSDSDDSKQPVRRSRRSKRSLVTPAADEPPNKTARKEKADDNDENDDDDDGDEIEQPSKPLPKLPLKRFRRKLQNGGIASDSEKERQEGERSEDDGNNHKNDNDDSAMLVDSQPASQSQWEQRTTLTRNTPRFKVRTAWETFLAYQLPMERTLRPDDSVQDALRNMSRTWTLLTTSEREVYERMARDGWNKSKPLDAEAQQYMERLRGGRAVGMFASPAPKTTQPSQLENQQQGQGRKQNTTVSASASVSLPQTRRRAAAAAATKDDAVTAEPIDLDDIFPPVSDVMGSEGEEDNGRKHVRPPPPTRRK